MEARDILKLIPHRYPFALVDRVLDHKPFDWIKARKNVTINEPFFTGHFPGQPVMPGVKMIEAMAQVSGILALLSLNPDLADHPEQNDDAFFVLAGVDKARFRKLVIPGDQLHMHMQVVVKKSTLWKVAGEVEVDGHCVAQATILISKGGNV
ncbi:3-hydroxyacyl-ACP dehydratase FabZ [Gammaproteobacteria bacterium]|nr:3-hydroxyacyl-ACP dehydratase FabZ [Gammaproteobacteria bacterium]